MTPACPHGFAEWSCTLCHPIRGPLDQLARAMKFREAELAHDAIGFFGDGRDDIADAIAERRDFFVRTRFG